MGKDKKKKKFTWKRLGYRLSGNFIISFLTPLVGANVVGVEFYQTIYLSLIASLIVTGIVFGRELEKRGKSS